MAGLSQVILRPLRRLQLSWLSEAGQEVSMSGWVRSAVGSSAVIQLLGRPSSVGRLVAGLRFKLAVPTDTGLAHLTACAINYEPVKGELLLEVLPDASLEERRRFVRVPVDLPPIIAGLAGVDNRPGQSLSTRLLDLSGGGTRLVSPEPLEPTTWLTLPLPRDDAPPIVVTAKLVSCQPLRGGEGYEIRAEFVDLLPEVREQILTDLVLRQHALAWRKARVS